MSIGTSYKRSAFDTGYASEYYSSSCDAQVSDRGTCAASPLFITQFLAMRSASSRHRGSASKLKPSCGAVRTEQIWSAAAIDRMLSAACAVSRSPRTRHTSWPYQQSATAKAASWGSMASGELRRGRRAQCQHNHGWC